MLQSNLFAKTLREAPRDEEAINAKLLIRAGYVDKTMAGVYTMLPLGLRVMNRIEQIVREEMNEIGGQEILMPGLQPKENWTTTGRWEGPDQPLKVLSRFEMQYALGPTHEEIITPLVKKFILSYKDLPFATYQIQTKFRDEARAKSGLLRGREFRMKDLYSFHADEDDLLKYYEVARKSYAKIFKRIGLKALYVEASGGSFSKFSHEFQVISPAGEDTIFYCNSCGFSKNKEIIGGELVKLKPGDSAECPDCGKELKVESAIEVGNIFPLKTRYSEPFKLSYKDKDGKEKIVFMGCYGIGINRIMGAIVEVSHDEQGIIWPASVSPFQAHLIELNGASGKKLYEDLQKEGIEVLYDQREVSAGQKLMDADLLGISTRLVVSPQTEGKIEVKARGEKKPHFVTWPHVIESIRNQE